MTPHVYFGADLSSGKVRHRNEGWRHLHGRSAVRHRKRAWPQAPQSPRHSAKTGGGQPLHLIDPMPEEEQGWHRGFRQWQGPGPVDQGIHQMPQCNRRCTGKRDTCPPKTSITLKTGQGSVAYLAALRGFQPQIRCPGQDQAQRPVRSPQGNGASITSTQDPLPSMKHG